MVRVVKPEPADEIASPWLNQGLSGAGLSGTGVYLFLVYRDVMVSQKDKEYFKKIGEAKKRSREKTLKRLKELSPEERFIKSFVTQVDLLKKAKLWK